MSSEEFGRSGDMEPVYEVCDPESAHPQWAEVRDEVNYVASWRVARRVALRLRTVLSGLGVGRQVFARVRGDGSAVVCVELEVASAAALALLLDEALRERVEAAPKIRGAPSRHVV